MAAQKRKAHRTDDVASKGSKEVDAVKKVKPAITVVKKLRAVKGINVIEVDADNVGERRRIAVLKSVGSARLEGAEPSPALRGKLDRYLKGEITAAQLRAGRD